MIEIGNDPLANLGDIVLDVDDVGPVFQLVDMYLAAQHGLRRRARSLKPTRAARGAGAWRSR